MSTTHPDWTPTAITLAAIERAAAVWRKGLVDVSRGNKRLYYAPLKVGTLSFAGATPVAIGRLLARDEVKLTELFPDLGTPESLALLAKARKASEVLHGKSRIGLEETGDNPTRLAIGLASWIDAADGVESGRAKEGARRPKSLSAPLLLAPIAFTLMPGSRGVSSIQITGEPEFNLALRYVLHAQHGLEIDSLGWLDEAVDDDGTIRPGKLLAAARSLVDHVDGWAVREHVAVDSFGSDRELMLRDLEDPEVLAAHPLIAAMAGDTSAQALFDRTGVPDDGSDLSLPDLQPPTNEFLILDADASQQSVIEHALAGRSLVVQGPPGTGKSQTISNLIASAAAHGKTVLFVAQKRAAVDAVLKRLEHVGLGELVLEVFDTRTKRGNVIAQLSETLDGLSTTPSPDTRTLHRDLARSRDVLVAHGRAMHSPRPELAGGTIFELLGKLAGIELVAQSQTRLPSAVVSTWQGPRTDALADQIGELVSLGGLDPDLATRPGWAPDRVISEELARQAYDTAATLFSDLPEAQHQLESVFADVGLPAPTSPAQGAAGVRLLTAIALHTTQLHLHVLDRNHVDDLRLARLIASVGSGVERKALPDRLGFFARRKLRKVLVAEHYAGADTEPSDDLLHDWLTHAAELRQHWHQTPLGVPNDETRPAPTVPSALPALNAMHAALESQLDTAQSLVQHVQLPEMSWTEATAWARRLLADPERDRYPRAYYLRSALSAAKAGPVLDALSARLRGSAGVDASFAADYLRWVSWHSALDQLAPAVPSLTGDLGALTAEEERFADADRAHVHANRVRVDHANARRMRDLLNADPVQQRAVQDQTRRKRGLKSLRQLLDEAPDALLALKPCWAMSPLLVSRYLPAVAGLFDMVVMDEASQIVLSDAVPSLLRGRQAIIAGDDKQLPPTTIFTKMLDSGYDPNSDVHGDIEEEGFEDEGDLVAADVDLTGDITVVKERPDPTQIGVSAIGYDSILTALGVFLPSRTLLWHYRSRDERLIASSNEGVYNGKLITFPGAIGQEALQHVVVQPSEGLGKNNKSPRAEVDRVVELILAHARAQADRVGDALTLGVIAMGREHAERIEKAVWDAMETALDRDELVAMFDEGLEEPTFIKSIERVQGDERDVIILTPGYGPSRDGQMRYQWGPLFGEYGVNRVNVAISRARQQMTLVSSFSADMLPDKGDSFPGYQLVRSFTRFASTSGELAAGTGRAVEMNPFEVEIYDRLTNAGLKVDAQWGASKYRLDFAVRHPDFDGSNGPLRHVLAVEADGRMWHSGYTARERDRLRQQHLESLGWRFHRIWSTDWFRDPDTELEQTVAAYNTAVERSRAGLQPAEQYEAPDGNWDGASTHTAVQASTVTRPPPRWVSPGAPINTYTDRQLRELVVWLRKDGALRLADQVLTELMAVLGFRRRGATIVERLTAAQRETDRLS